MTAVTFLVVLPLTQVMEIFFIATGFAGALADGVGEGEAEGAGAATSWVSFTFTVGLEKVKP